MPSKNEKFCVLQIIESCPAQLSMVKSILNKNDYVEIDDVFYISADQNRINDMMNNIFNESIKYILVYSNNKAGCWVSANGTNDIDKTKLREIINPQYNY